MSSPLHLDVFVVPYKPITGLIPPMSKGEPTWPATSVSLISGERDAVLIDAVLTPEDAGWVKEWIRATGKNLTTIYITHGHGDHFFGLNTLLAAFPDARAPHAQGLHRTRHQLEQPAQPRPPRRPGDRPAAPAITQQHPGGTPARPGPATGTARPADTSATLPPQRSQQQAVRNRQAPGGPGDWTRTPAGRRYRK
jgi:glyoxylase-like metal-dependent hydrolase (beta-lactamase superfamily II)